MTTYPFSFDIVDPSWKNCLEQGLAKIDPNYITSLKNSDDWMPGPQHIFSAFSLPMENVNYVLFGESPYPRGESANGYAFWDASVNELWSPSGLSKKVNRATSLRNIIKMLLVAEGLLHQDHTGQEEIAKLDKSGLVQTNQELFTNFLNHGILLLNASLVLQPTSKLKDARAWYPFMQAFLNCLIDSQPRVKFILLGNIANKIDRLLPPDITNKFYAEHPYNHTFINNPEVIAFFKPLHLLRKAQVLANS